MALRMLVLEQSWPEASPLAKPVGVSERLAARLRAATRVLVLGPQWALALAEAVQLVAQRQRARAEVQAMASVEIQALAPDAMLARIQDHLLDAGAKVQSTSAALIDQLRRFLDDQVWLENKRIMALIHEIETGVFYDLSHSMLHFMPP